MARPSYGKLQGCPCACVTCPPAGVRGARERESERGLRGRLREAPKSGQWTPRKRSSDERSGGLYEPSAWRLPPIGEPISGGPGRVRDGSGTGLSGALFWGPFWGSFWRHPGAPRYGAMGRLKMDRSLGDQAEKGPQRYGPFWGSPMDRSVGLQEGSFWVSFWGSFGDHFGGHFRDHFGDMLE